MKKLLLILFIFGAILFILFHGKETGVDKKKPIISTAPAPEKKLPSEKSLVSESEVSRTPAAIPSDIKKMGETEEMTKSVDEWLNVTSKYWGPDRPEKIDESIAQLKKLGDKVIPIIETKIDALPLTQEQDRASLVFILGELGRSTPGERNYIQAILDDYLYKSPQSLTPKELAEADLKYGFVQKGKDGQYYQDFTLTKLSVVKALERIGDEKAKESIARVIETPSTDSVIKHAALESLLRIAPDHFEEVPKEEIVK